MIRPDRWPSAAPAPEGSRVRELRQHLEPVDHARPVAVEQVAIDGVEPTRPDGGEIAEALPLLAHHRVAGRGGLWAEPCRATKITCGALAIAASAL